MEKVNQDTKLADDIKIRFQRIRQVIERIEECEHNYDQKVLDKFNTLDINGIEQLAKQRHENRELKVMLEEFLQRFE